MQPRSFRLVQPDLELTIPQSGGGPDKIEPHTIPELTIKIPNGALYLKIGEVRIQSYSAGGGSFATELDENISAYLVRCIDHSHPAAVLDALCLADAHQARDALIAMFNESEEVADAARKGADPGVVTLSAPIEVHGERIERLRLTEPTGRSFNRLGRPFTWTRMPGGGFHPVERLDVVRQYIEASIQHDLGADLLGLVKLPDAMQVKNAVMDFFTAAATIGAKNQTP